MLTKAFVLSKTNDANAFNDIVQNNGEDFWQVLSFECSQNTYYGYDLGCARTDILFIVSY